MSSDENNHDEEEEEKKASEAASSADKPHTSQPTGLHPGITYNKDSSAIAPLPSGMEMTGRPRMVPGVPPGLEYLVTLDQLLIHQQVEVLEAVVGWEGCNKYRIKNSLGQPVFLAAEESNVLMRQCCESRRGFMLHITDNFGQEVIRVKRVFKCFAGCCWCANVDCCSYELQVEAPVGNICGYVRQMQSGWTARYMIRDADGQDVLFIQGPCCIWNGICCTWDQKFKVFTSNKSQEVGVVSKQWSGLAKEAFTNAANFNATFPMDLDVRIKAVVVAAAFLIDFMFFEKKDKD